MLRIVNPSILSPLHVILLLLLLFSPETILISISNSCPSLTLTSLPSFSSPHLISVTSVSVLNKFEGRPVSSFFSSYTHQLLSWTILNTNEELLSSSTFFILILLILSPSLPRPDFYLNERNRDYEMRMRSARILSDHNNCYQRKGKWCQAAKRGKGRERWEIKHWDEGALNEKQMKNHFSSTKHGFSSSPSWFPSFLSFSEKSTDCSFRTFFDSFVLLFVLTVTDPLMLCRGDSWCLLFPLSPLLSNNSFVSHQKTWCVIKKEE